MPGQLAEDLARPRSASTTSSPSPAAARDAHAPRAHEQHAVGGAALLEDHARPPRTCPARPCPRARRSPRGSACAGTPRRSPRERLACRAVRRIGRHRRCSWPRRRRDRRRGRRRPAGTPRWPPRAPTPRPQGRGQLRRPHARAGTGAGARRRAVPLGERRQGDAARRLPAARRRPRPRAARRRARAARPDDPASPTTARPTRSTRASGCRRSARSPRRARHARTSSPTRSGAARLITADDQARFFLPHRPARAARATARTRCGCCAGSSPASAGASPRPCPTGWRIAFKGGWGPGVTRQVDHQAALLTNGRAARLDRRAHRRQPVGRLRRRDDPRRRARLLRGLDGAARRRPGPPIRQAVPLPSAR